jgi:hypothetical protein
MDKPQIPTSVQSAADYVMSYFDKYKNQELDLKTLSPDDFARISYSLRHGDQALDFRKHPDLYRFKLKILSYVSGM